MTTTTTKHITSGPVIVTRYLGPTNHHGSRIKATHKHDSKITKQVTINWDSSLESQANHQAAAKQLLNQWGYDNNLMIVGCGWDHDCYYWLTSSTNITTNNTLANLRHRVNQLIENQGEDAPCAAFIFTNDDVCTYKEQIKIPVNREVAFEVLNSIEEDYDYLYSEIFDCIDRELRERGLVGS
jgi:hypothetical protein